MNNRRFSKNIKKCDLINISKLFEEENTILKQEISVLNSLLKSQEERHQTELKSVYEENESLKYHNSELVKTTIELQHALKSIRSDLGAIHKKNSLNTKPALTSRIQETSRIYNDENILSYEVSNSSRSAKAINSKAKISPLRAGLMKDSKKISMLVTKIKRLKNI